MLFRKCGCLVGPENRIFRKSISFDCKKYALTMEIHFRSYFHFKWFPQRERERERERERRRSSDHAFNVADEPRALVRRSHAPDRTGLVDRSTAPIAPRRSISRALVRQSHAPDRTGLVDRNTVPIALRCSISPPRDLAFDPPISLSV